MSRTTSAGAEREPENVVRYPRQNPPPSAKYPPVRGEKTGPWRKSEDYILERWVEQKGPADWVGAALLIPGRTSKQCRERWHQNLNPALNHDPICEDEGKVIVQMVQQKGKKWAEIAREMRNNRSDNAIKNYWNGWNNCRKRQQRSASATTTSPPASHPYLSHSYEPQPTSPTHSLAPCAHAQGAPLPHPNHHFAAQHYRPSPRELSLPHRLQHSTQQFPAPCPQTHVHAPGKSPSDLPRPSHLASPVASTPSTEVSSARLASCSPLERYLGDLTPSPRSSATEPASFTTSRRNSLATGRAWGGAPAIHAVPRTPQTDVWQHRMSAPAPPEAIIINAAQWHQDGTDGQTQPQDQSDWQTVESKPVHQPLDQMLRVSRGSASQQHGDTRYFHSHQMPGTPPLRRRGQSGWHQTEVPNQYDDDDAKRRKISVAAICN